MKKERKDLRIIRTKELIHQAFKDLICEMDYSKITVKELAERAGINRKTFYLHYNSLEDLLEEFQNDLTKDFINKTDQFRRPWDLNQITREFFYVCESSKLYERLICSDSYFYISQQITENIMNQTWKDNPEFPLNSEELKILMTFVSRSTIEIYRTWVKNERKIPLDRLIEITSSLICNGIDGIKNPYI